MERRSFIKKAMTGSAFLAAGSFPLSAFNKPEILKLTILHTNDQHSRIEEADLQSPGLQRKRH